MSCISDEIFSLLARLIGWGLKAISFLKGNNFTVIKTQKILWVVQLRSPVLTATGLVNENSPCSTSHRINIP